jgi:hypothetical protein
MYVSDLPNWVVLTFPVGRCFLTPTSFKNAKWSLGRFSRPMNFVSFVWNTYLAAVLFSPLQFPVTGDTFNCKQPRSWLLMLIGCRLVRDIWGHHPLWVYLVAGYP